jgi:hypothetical protein
VPWHKASMDLPIIGSHCSLSSCNELDLLPIRCRCDKAFCRFHISPETHDCPSQTRLSNVATTPTGLRRCAREHCSKPALDVSTPSPLDSLEPDNIGCPQCHLSFCVKYVSVPYWFISFEPIASNLLAVIDTLTLTRVTHQTSKCNLRTQQDENSSRSIFPLPLALPPHPQPKYPQIRRSWPNIERSSS